MSVEEVANSVLDEVPVLVPEDLFLLEQIAFSRGIQVFDQQLDGAEANILMLPGFNPIITVSSRINNYERRRFSIAHELGHFELHRNNYLFNICTSRDLSESATSSTNNLEHEANRFASCLLLPSRFVGKRLLEEEPSFTLITDIATRFSVSLTASAFRLIDFSMEPIAIVYSENGRIKYYKATKQFSDCEIFINIGEPLTIGSSAGKFFNSLPVGEGWNDVRANEWLKDGPYKNDATIREWSINMPNFNSVLTLLWVFEELSDDDLA